ncbi:uncharacterized protein FFMR_04131 [Fusarium fujikuroi]|nr:uncharacterized protein FFMR_04131 [Fusarium fujikuroi]
MPALQIPNTVVRQSLTMQTSECISGPSSSCVAADNSLNEPGHATPLPSKTINGVRTKRGGRVKREPPKLSSSKAKSQGSMRKRLLAGASHNGAFEGEDSGNDNPHREPFSSETWLACPFFKHDPAKYCKLRACQTPGWPSMGRVKEHIMRRHKADMSTSQIDCLQSRSKYSSKSDEERWMDTFNILFPEAQKPQTPYCSDPSHERITSINREVLKLLNERLSQDSMFNGSPMLMQRIPEIVDGCMTSAMAKCQNPERSYPAPPNQDQTSMQLELDYPQILPPNFGTEESDVGCLDVGFNQNLSPWLTESEFWQPQTSNLLDFGWGGP